MQNNLTRGSYRLAIAAWLVCGTIVATRASADPSPAAAGVDGVNLHPLTGLFAAEPIYFAPSDGWSLDWRVASHSARDARAASTLLLDGETNHVRLRWQRRLGARWQLAVSVPYVTHAGGALDAGIDQWHEWFGLPDGIRDERPRDVLEFRYVERGTTIVAFERRRRGLGDVRVAGRYAFAPGAAGQWSASARVKLATGDVERLTGSGGYDLAAGLHWHSRALDSRWYLAASAGGYRLGRTTLTDGAGDRFGLNGSLAAKLQLSSKLSLDAALVVHDGVFDSTLAKLDHPAALLITGGTLAFGDDWLLRLDVTEDIRVESAPDVTFRIGLSRRR